MTNISDLISYPLHRIHKNINILLNKKNVFDAYIKQNYIEKLQIT